MASVTVQSPAFDDVILVKLSREIAMDVNSVADILKRYAIGDEQWDKIQNSARFAQLLRNAVEEWESALNTHERVKIKSATMIEVWLEHANSLLHKETESITGKTELAKFIGRLADMGLTNAKVDGAMGEKFSITINLGADQTLKFEKQLPPKVIEHEPSPTQEL
jgi:hypothetical protein